MRPLDKLCFPGCHTLRVGSLTPIGQTPIPEACGAPNACVGRAVVRALPSRPSVIPRCEGAPRPYPRRILIALAPRAMMCWHN